MTFQQKLDSIATDILNKLRQSFKDKKMIATGKSVNSLRYETNKFGFSIWGADWLYYTEHGRGARKSNQESDFLKNLEAWAKAVGFPVAKVEFLRYWLNKFGTRLYRGEDPRFSGNQSKVLTDVLNEQLILAIKTQISVFFLASYKANFQNIIKKQNV